MPAPRVFVSSTAYDLGLLRGQLRAFIHSLGYEAVLSEYSDVLFDPKAHAHLSCLNEIQSCDILILVVGSRFGSDAIPEAAQELDLEELAKLSSSPELISGEHPRLSVTQLEVLRAIERGLPVYAFIDERVLQDHATYEANREREFASQITFASIGDAESAEFIFRFIDFLKGRVTNNAVFGYSEIEDIQSDLRKQWAALFQRQLQEDRDDLDQKQVVESLNEQFEDLKAAILSSMVDATTRETARGILNFRTLVDVIKELPMLDSRQVVEDAESNSWDNVLEMSGVETVTFVEDDTKFPSGPVISFLVGPPMQFRSSRNRWFQLADDWGRFRELPKASRLTIFDTLSEVRTGMPLLRRYSPPKPGYDLDEEPF